MVSSLDGFIASQEGSYSWMESKDTYENGATLTDEEIAAFLAGIDCYLMGAKTYELALELGWPYGEKPVVVLTHRTLPKAKPSVAFYRGDIEVLVNQQLKKAYQNIWMVGGAMVAKELIRQELADEIVVSIVPIILGAGTLFFDYVDKEQLLHLQGVKAYQNGMVELHYEVKKSG